MCGGGLSTQGINMWRALHKRNQYVKPPHPPSFSLLFLPLIIRRRGGPSIEGTNVWRIIHTRNQYVGVSTQGINMWKGSPQKESICKDSSSFLLLPPLPSPHPPCSCGWQGRKVEGGQIEIRIPTSPKKPEKAEKPEKPEKPAKQMREPCVFTGITCFGEEKIKGSTVKTQCLLWILLLFHKKIGSGDK